ncbi:hypothetical protein FA15DRAFT_624853 [Coprinopsis marcescibilis]|uniref:Actin-like ATPase domain-containing protein n=1 Tax=Coprinopsis marcescibilis TaxID=230819 RepID=A0A5C3KLN0_COPMA|nr:hypothetical protein FA15DRAFT_624853 [Coprinopsis marcescibilis]
MTTPVPRSIYRGTRRKIVLAFDVGTTFSGVSYACVPRSPLLAHPPTVYFIKRPSLSFPAQEHITGASKIPTMIYYDQTGTPQAIGAEAMRDGVYETAEEQGWVKAEWFKLHLRPSSAFFPAANPNPSPSPPAIDPAQIPPLPLALTPVRILAHFLAYLYKCAAEYIKDTHATLGPGSWSMIERGRDVDYVLSHPNGWEGHQQEAMREAMVLAGLVGVDGAAQRDRIKFVTEGEASLHFCINNGLPPGAMNNGDGVVVVDAGGGTIDVSTYARAPSPTPATTSSPFEEIAPSQCHFHGSIFVSIRARQYLDGHLQQSQFYDDLDHIIRCFDRTTKLRFRSVTDPQYVKFGSTRDNDPAAGIRFGQLKVQGTQVAAFFEPSVRCILNAVYEQRKLAHRPISHVVLVGGFAASDWLFHKVQEALKPQGYNVVRPENHVNKAVSDGALSFYLDHHVHTRIAKLTYGNFCHVPYNDTDGEHRERLRAGLTFVAMSGSRRVVDCWDVILPKNTQIAENGEFRRNYFRESVRKVDFCAVTFTVWGYRGEMREVRWRDSDSDNFTALCTIEVDLGKLTLQPRTDAQGGVYFRLDYAIVLLFGSTELKAQIAWFENVSDPVTYLCFTSSDVLLRVWRKGQCDSHDRPTYRLTLAVELM